MTNKAKLLTAAGVMFGSVAFASPALANSPNMVIQGQTNPPIGHYEFCRRAPAECQAIGGPSSPMALSKDNWRVMLEINHRVNSAIRPLTDMQIHGVQEVWSYPQTVGDCEDYVLLKRNMLMNAGFKASDLLITVVLQPNGEGHAVLTVRTDHGDFILDNLRSKVLLWTDTEYRFLKRQSSQHAAKWTKIRDGRTISVGSIR